MENSDHLPKITGTNSLYVTCWYIAMSNLLASWYIFPSFHAGFNLFNSSHSMLCNRNKEIVLTAILGCWLTLKSPG
jgi:hypothetical protein